MSFSRRQLLAVALLPALPAAATPEALEAAIRAHTGGATLRSGRITIEIAELVENGNAVPLSVSVQSPMTAADHVRSLAVFTERNPQPEVAVFHLSPRSGRARVDTRIRLATSQPLVAVATMSDGSVWRHQVDVIVTLAACIES
jgi:sulfur-oxidizing protein SoxY